jgi:hypothetical protein
VQAVDNISPESEPGDARDRGGLDDQIAEPQGKLSLRDLRLLQQYLPIGDIVRLVEMKEPAK